MLVTVAIVVVDFAACTAVLEAAAVSVFVLALFARLVGVDLLFIEASFFEGKYFVFFRLWLWRSHVNCVLARNPNI
jgi:hypothetical protein